LDLDYYDPGAGMAEAGDMAAEMERVLKGLAQARQYVAGHDQADTARELADRLRYSPLRTLLEQSERSAERVMTYLREQDRT
jgi:hypothetical protein